MSDFGFVRDTAGDRRPIWFVTGTDTDVGKTVVTARLATAIREHFGDVTIVKPIQTGLGEGEAGDAEIAGTIAACASTELVRLPLPADPWLAAQDAGVEPLHIDDLQQRIQDIEGPLVVEGAGGIMVPLNADETFLDLAVRLEARVIIIVGLRLGCINHAKLTATALRARNAQLAGFILVDRWGESSTEYRAHLFRALEPHCAVLAYLSYDRDVAARTF